MENKISIVKELIINNKLEDAIEILDVLKEEELKNWEVFFELGKIYFIKENLKSAIYNLKSSLKLKNNLYTKLLLAKSYKKLKFNFKALKLFLNIRKFNINELKKEIDNDVISMFLESKSYMSILKYMDKYEIDDEALKKKNLEYLFDKIDELNFIGSSKQAKNLAKKALFAIKNLNDRNKNILINEIEIADNKTKLKSYPRILELGLTQNCNLKCRMCNTYSSTKKYSELNDKCIDIFIELFKYVETVTWIGGEPLIFNNIEHLFDIANEYGVKQKIVTNGLLLNKRLIEKIVDYDIEVTISIDSVDKNIYENIRCGGNFDVLVNNIEYINKYRKQKNITSKFVLHSVLSRWNCDYDNNFIDIMKFANKYGFTTVEICKDNFEKDKNLIESYLNKFNLSRNIIVDIANKFNIDLSINFGNLCYTYEPCSANSDFKNNGKYCLLLWKKMFIRFDGSVFVDCKCPQIGDFSKNISEEYLINDIWNGQQIVSYRSKVINNDINCLEKICNSNVFLRKG